MIISKTPLRMSFVGGGSDLPAYYIKHGGAVISSAINAFVFVIVKEKFDPGIRFSYSKTENVNHFSELEHPLAKNALKLLNVNENIEIVSIAEIPSTGTGLGSSSSFSVGLINALSKYKSKNISKHELAKTACHLEIDLAKSPIGKQDQYAAAFGGMKVYKFNPDETVSIEDVLIPDKKIRQLDSEILSFYIGGKRDANSILKDQGNQLKNTSKVNSMKKMVDLVWDMKRELEVGDISNFGSILDENWRLKREISNSISDKYIDEIYEEAILCGSSGGKLLGAGGGGFMIFHAPTNEIKNKLRDKLKNLREVAFKIESQGSRIINFE